MNDNNLSHIDNILNSIEKIEEVPATQVVSFGPNTVLSVLQNTSQQLEKLDQIADKLIDHFLEPSTLNRLSEKEKERLLMNVSELQKEKRDAIFRFMEMGQKNTFMNKILEMQSNSETLMTEDGIEVISQNFSPERKLLADKLRGILNERYQQG